ncbi:ergothioneine biosynthesis protein EgtB [Hyphobacterium sp.]|uniref:ergothioneine biosynthesis protein EgtB n=1 Tax=Hyphobacterium sp. TaxID=2004662 RepID=UPI003BABCC7A
MAHPALAYRPHMDDRATCRARFNGVRAQTLSLTDGLAPEDMQIQTMPDVSPTKWHLAHVTWFFETFIAKPYLDNYQEFDPRFGYLFNSYYEQVGAQWSRSDRGLLSRPLHAEILNYRHHVENAIGTLIDTASGSDWALIAPLVELGCHHERQHQELLLTDIKHVLSQAPDPHAPFGKIESAPDAGGELAYLTFGESLIEMGASPDGFVFDNELPRHRRWLDAFEISARPVSNAEYLQFLDDGGYQNFRLWLSDGWAWLKENDVQHPLYWRKTQTGWQEYTLHGLAPLQPGHPVCHISAYEAAAFAEWAGGRLPTEPELEQLAIHHPAEGQLLGANERYHPGRLIGTGKPEAVIGGVWEWSSSGYEAYPGYRAPDGAVGEYNGKFMSGQQVLRGGSCATGRDHIRPTYRNFFPANAQWQFSGIRLAKR